MMPTWRPHPTVTSYDCDVLATDEEFARGECSAIVECFGDSISYPTAINAVTGNQERGGPMEAAPARAWAERVAGLHPLRPSDERAPSYYLKEAT